MISKFIMLALSLICLWFVVLIMLCEGHVRDVDWVGFGGRSGVRFSCMVDAGVITAAIAVISGALLRWLPDVAITRAAEDRIGAWALGIGFGIFFALPSASCVFDPASIQLAVSFDGPYGREIGCFVLPAITAGVPGLLVALILWFDRRR